MPFWLQLPDEPNYVDLVNQYAKVLTGQLDAGQLSLLAPLAAPGATFTGAASAGAGLGIGTYRYKATFVTGIPKPDGTIMVVGETLPSSSVVVTTSSGNQQVSLTNLPVGPTGTIARRVYRTAVGGADGTQKLVFTVQDNTTTAWIDTMADASLGTAVPTTNTTGTKLAGAGNIGNTPSGNIAAQDVQAAINELDAEKAGLTLTNTFTQRQTFGAGIQDGDSNQDVSFRQALGLAIDTRSWTATAWDATNSDLPTTIEVKDGLTLVATISITYNSAGKPTQMVVTAGGKTVTYAQAWNNLTQFAGRTKAVV
jgi:hypothetical protein